MKSFNQATGNAASNGDWDPPSQEAMWAFMARTKAKEERDERRFHAMEEKMGGMNDRIAMLENFSSGRKKNKHHAPILIKGEGMLFKGFVLGLLLGAFFHNFVLRYGRWGNAAPSLLAREHVRADPLVLHRLRQPPSEDMDDEGRIEGEEWTVDLSIRAAASALKNVPPRLVQGDTNNTELLHQQTGDVIDTDSPVDMASSGSNGNIMVAAPSTLGRTIANPRKLGALPTFKQNTFKISEMLKMTEAQIERDVLTDIYDSSNGPQWIMITNWREEGVSHCDWYGVTCDESHRTIKLDLNNNGLAGTLSKRIGELKSLRYLDLGNNNIKGLIPDEISSLPNITTLNLSYNSFQGDHDLDFEQNERNQVFELFLVHGNMLSGNIKFKPNPEGDASYFVADCGEPSAFDLDCDACAMCCNSEEKCREVRLKEELNIAGEVLGNSSRLAILFTALVGALFLLAVAIHFYYRSKLNRNHFGSRTLHSSRRPSACERDNEYALQIIGEDSVYRFFLSRSWWGWMFAFATIAVQMWSLSPFLAVVGNAYVWHCLSFSLECIDTSDRDLSWHGWTVFSIMMAVHLLKDFISGLKLIKLGARPSLTSNERFRYFCGGVFLVIISMFTLVVSTIYVGTTALSDTDLIQDSVVILFVMEVDERVYDIVSIINKSWTDQTSKTVRTVTYQEFRNQIEDLEEIIESLRMQIERRQKTDAKPGALGENSSCTTLTPLQDTKEPLI